MGILNPEKVTTQGVRPEKGLLENIEALIIQWGDGGLFNICKNLALIAIILFIVIEGVKLVIKGKEGGDVKEAVKNLWYIALGAVFIRGASWLFGNVLNVGQNANFEDLATRASQGQWSLVWEVLSLFKGGAFFYAIIMLVVTGFRVVAAADGEKGKVIAKGVINVVVALLIIKGVDYIYYMASQDNFISEATEFIKNLAKVFGFLYGAAATGIVIFAGYSLVTDNGTGEWMKKAKGRLINLAVSGLVLFGFLLILYQLFDEFS